MIVFCVVSALSCSTLPSGVMNSSYRGSEHRISTTPNGDSQIGKITGTWNLFHSNGPT